VIDRDGFVFPRYSYTVYVKEIETEDWAPIVDSKKRVYFTKDKAIDRAREDIKQMKHDDRESGIIYEEEVP
jgi:hypothetical protein